MRSKLEPGCRAIIIGGKSGVSIGKIVKVGKFAGDDVPWKAIEVRDYWETDHPLLFSTGNYYNYCSEKLMQRIDDHPEDETILELNEIDV